MFFTILLEINIASVLETITAVKFLFNKKSQHQNPVTNLLKKLMIN
jgi:hypothetical protein